MAKSGSNTNGAACYIITKRGAQKLVEAIPKAGGTVIDHFMFGFEHSGIKPLHVLPYPARQSRLFPSTIATDLAQTTPFPEGMPIQARTPLPKPKKRRRTMREVLQIRSRRSKDVFRSFWNSRKIIGPRMLLLSVARVQSKKSARA